ncbi:HalOD1 output domain-containing protein [Salinadaptatus halalkaliphilus]|uniref:HalOD1 output domain-containing protein n=1 Tax=Salinadaptatus halalkaliphilus TaxID=2419781 RepID=UPI00158043E8|nr:HalOD1 output domain-containing protein [Salinadaptatus halalkaliphilus]
MDEPLGVTIATQIAAQDGADPVALEPPLYDVIDIDALERLIQPESHERTSFEGIVSFEYQEYTVTVTHTGDVSVTPADASQPKPDRTGDTMVDCDGSSVSAGAARE